MRENLAIGLTIFSIIVFFLLLTEVMKRYRLKKIRRRMHYYYGKWRDTEYSDEVISVIRAYADSKEKMIDDITWNDLDLDQVFQQINHTWSFAGEDYLYYLLHIPTTSREQWKEQEELIAYYQEHEQERVELQMIFAGIGKNHGSSVYKYIRRSIEDTNQFPLLHYGCLLFFVLSLISFFYGLEVGISMIMICMVANIGLYFYKRKRLESSMQALQYFLRLQNGARQVIKKKLIPNEIYHERIQKDYTRLKKKLGNTTLLRPPDWGNQSMSDMLLDYVRMITHIDGIMFYHCMRRLNREIDVMENLITTMGFLESMVAIGSFRAGLPYYCMPDLKGEGGLDIEDAYHPLLEQAVPNSICAKRGILITGSNASGKSTFLKTIAINVILAQGLHTCAAKRYSGKWYTVLSSMALRDNLYQGESYYITEIKALKRVLDIKQAEPEADILCFVDEVLRGTNTVERIAASVQVLKKFSQNRILCFAATHDIELTYLLEQFYENYHFQEQVVDGDILFDYLIYEGRSSSRNAIRLLELLGYDREITDGAEQMVEGFLESGKWAMAEE